MSDPAGTTISQAARRSIATIGAFRNRDRLLAALQAEFGVALPVTPSFIQAGPVTFSCLAPTRYLATADRDANLPARLATSLAGLAAVTDQSDMWDILTLSGPLIRDVLARLVPIDLTPAKFQIGHLASTRAGHLNVRLWRVADLAYELAVPRSYAEDLRFALSAESIAAG